MMFGYKDKPNFSVENEKEISTAPKVDFNPTPLRRQVAEKDKPLMNCESRPCALLCWLVRRWLKSRPAAGGARGRSNGTLSSSGVDTLNQTIRAFEARRAARSRMIVPTTDGERWSNSRSG